VTGVMLRAFVVGSMGVVGSRGRRMVISTNETAKVASTDQFFYFILECFAFFCTVGHGYGGSDNIWSCQR